MGMDEIYSDMTEAERNVFDMALDTGEMDDVKKVLKDAEERIRNERTVDGIVGRCKNSI